IKASVTTPGNLQFGFANSSFKHTLFAVDLVLQNYSRFKDIPLNFSKTVGTATPAEVRFAFNFRDTFFLRTGFEKRITSKNIIRGGYYFDRSAVEDANVSPFFPDSSKNVATGGFSRQMGNKEFTLFYQAAFQVDRTTNVPANANLYTNGLYHVTIHLFGFGMRTNVHGTTIDTH